MLDALSELLKAVAVRGAVYYNAEFSAPWCLRAPPSEALAAHITSGDAHVIIYHFMIEGSAWARTEDGPKVDLAPGEIIVFPHGHVHFMGAGVPSEPVDNEQAVQEILSRGLDVARMGGGGEVTRFICGYIVCDPAVSHILLAGLPPLFKVNIGDDPSGLWLENSIQFAVTQAGRAEPGAEVVLAKLSEALFAETLRRYLLVLPPDATGWLAGARDPEVGKALSLMHRDASRAWTVADLAGEVGLSRAVLAERFRTYLGEGPIAYLSRWRMHLGARLLSTTSHSVAEVATAAGYDSEAAFNRAFKREFGVPPARFRRQLRSGDGHVQRAASSGGTSG